MCNKDNHTHNHILLNLKKLKTPKNSSFIQRLLKTGFFPSSYTNPRQASKWKMYNFLFAPKGEYVFLKEEINQLQILYLINSPNKNRQFLLTRSVILDEVLARGRAGKNNTFLMFIVLIQTKTYIITIISSYKSEQKLKPTSSPYKLMLVGRGRPR